MTALTFLILGRAYFAKNPIRSEQPLLNERTLQYQGRVFTIVEPIIDGVGKVQIDGSLWRVEGADCAVGTRVRVIKASGMHLGVEIVAADESSDEAS
jgi:membrane protein implicated in regulation of membrane protease activity